MIVVTAVLIFVTLIFAPIHFRIDATAYLQKLAASFSVKVGVLKVFNENISLSGTNLVCKGTVTTDVELTTVDSKSSIDLLKCITVDRLCISLQNNILHVSMFYVALENAFMALCTSTLCNLFHCQFYTQVTGTIGESSVRMQAKVSTSVAEVSICLAKQGVRQWKTHKSKK